MLLCSSCGVDGCCKGDNSDCCRIAIFKCSSYGGCFGARGGGGVVVVVVVVAVGYWCWWWQSGNSGDGDRLCSRCNSCKSAIVRCTLCGGCGCGCGCGGGF